MMGLDCELAFCDARVYGRVGGWVLAGVTVWQFEGV